jgi:hypothetical protein
MALLAPTFTKDSPRKLEKVELPRGEGKDGEGWPLRRFLRSVFAS